MAEQIKNKRKVVSTPIMALGIIFLGIPFLIGITAFFLSLITPEIKSKTRLKKQQIQQVKVDVPDKIEAYTVAHEFVLKELLAPKTAKFPWGSDVHKVINTGNRYKVTSYVDAQNAFGALIRNRYSVIMEYHGNGEWKLVSVNLKPSP